MERPSGAWLSPGMTTTAPVPVLGVADEGLPAEKAWTAAGVTR
jgi:hypothetical protein